MAEKKSRIMYIERKQESLNGPARIGRMWLSKTGLSFEYQGKRYLRLGGQGFKANYFEEETRDEYWISGPRKDGADRLYAQSSQPVEIDDDVAEEYWRDIRGRK